MITFEHFTKLIKNSDVDQKLNHRGVYDYLVSTLKNIISPVITDDKIVEWTSSWSIHSKDEMVEIVQDLVEIKLGFYDIDNENYVPDNSIVRKHKDWKETTEKVIAQEVVNFEGIVVDGGKYYIFPHWGKYTLFGNV